MLAARGGHYNCVKELLQKGASVNNQDSCGKTSLVHAVRCHTEKLEDKASGSKSMWALLQAGADVNIKNCFGMTALMIAIENGFRQKTQIL